MRRSLSLALAGLPLMLVLACSGGGDSTAPVAATPANSALFVPDTTQASFFIPLPNVLATAVSPDPTIGRASNTPMTPPEALAYINLREMGGTNAVSGLNAPIYLRFFAPVDPATVTGLAGPANVKVFQITPDSAGTENNPLTFSDVSGMFSYQYTTGGTDLFLFPNFPLQPASRYMYVVTNRVKDAATGASLIDAPIFAALKSTTPITWNSDLEQIRRNVLYNPDLPQNNTTNPILFSGYAKVMDDLITATSSTTITSRNDIRLLGRFITGASAISLNTKYPSDTGALYIPVESALRAFALGAARPGNGLPSGLLTSKTWSNTITVPANTATSLSTFIAGTAASPDIYWHAATGSNAPTSVGTIVLGTINSADLSMDPVVVSAFHAANPTLSDMTGTTGAYNPAAGVVQAFRPDGAHAMGFYSTDRPVPFLYIAPNPAVVGAAPAGGWPLVIYAHGIGGQKEHALAVAQTLTSMGRAVIAIDEPLHGQLAVPGHTTGTSWFMDFTAFGAPLAFRSNIQQGAFNLDRLELTVRLGGFAGLGAAAPVMGLAADIKFVGQSLGSIIGAYYLAGNTSLSLTGYPYTQPTLNGDMKGYLSVPAGRWAYIGQDATSSFEPTVTLGLAAAHIAKGSPTYNQFFLLTQTVIDPTDPASVTTPLAALLPSRLSNRVAMQESVGDGSIPNTFARYFGNALGGREVLGTTAPAAAVVNAIAPLFKQLAYVGGGTPSHAAVVPAQFMYTITTGALAQKFTTAAAAPAGPGPTQGYFQFDQPGIGHNSLIDPSNLTNLSLIQRQMASYLGGGFVIDPTQAAAGIIVGVPMKELQWTEPFRIIGH